MQAVVWVTRALGNPSIAHPHPCVLKALHTAPHLAPHNAPRPVRLSTNIRSRSSLVRSRSLMLCDRLRVCRYEHALSPIRTRVHSHSRRSRPFTLTLASRLHSPSPTCNMQVASCDVRVLRSWSPVRPDVHIRNAAVTQQTGLIIR